MNKLKYILQELDNNTYMFYSYISYNELLYRITPGRSDRLVEDFNYYRLDNEGSFTNFKLELIYE
jgi:hypothetical protein